MRKIVSKLSSNLGKRTQTFFFVKSDRAIKDSVISQFSFIGKIASQYESYHGTQVAKEAFLEVIMALQPARMYHRAVVPLLLIKIGRDNEAYNFIKFWLKNTPKGIKVYKDLDAFLAKF